MVVLTADLIRVSLLEAERDPVLFIDTHAQDARAIALQGLQPIARWDPERVKSACRVDPVQLTAGDRPQRLWQHAPRPPTVGTHVEGVSAIVRKGLNHAP